MSIDPNSLDFWNFVIAVAALVMSIVFPLFNWRQTRKALKLSQEALELSKTIFEQSVTPELDIMLDDIIWDFDKSLMLHITNLGEAPAKNVKVCIGARRHGNETGAWINFENQPFSLLGNQSGQARQSMDIASSIWVFLLHPMRVLARSSQHKYGVMLKPDAEKIIPVIRIECRWESGGVHPNLVRLSLRIDGSGRHIGALALVARCLRPTGPLKSSPVAQFV
jgi:hypothetical protein